MNTLLCEVLTDSRCACLLQQFNYHWQTRQNHEILREPCMDEWLFWTASSAETLTRYMILWISHKKVRMLRDRMPPRPRLQFSWERRTLSTIAVIAFGSQASSNLTTTSLQFRSHHHLHCILRCPGKQVVILLQQRCEEHNMTLAGRSGVVKIIEKLLACIHY